MSHSLTDPKMQLVTLAMQLATQRATARTDAERHRIDAQLEYVRLQLEAQDRAAKDARVTLALTMLKDTSDRQFDLLVMTFTRFIDILVEDYRSLIQERERVSDRMAETKDIELKNNFRKRLSGIGSQISGVQNQIKKLVRETNFASLELGSALRLPMPLLAP